jgi:hypothetical protein
VFSGETPASAMMIEHFVDGTGLVALSLSVTGLIAKDDRTLTVTGGWASAVWALNNLLIGAQTAAALSALSVGRQAGVWVLQGHPRRLKGLAFSIVAVATVLIALLTWNGSGTVFPVAGSLVASYAVFYQSGAKLRLAMVVVNALWMHNAVSYGSGWQVAANLIAGAAAAIGAWRAFDGAAPRCTALTHEFCDACA